MTINTTLSVWSPILEHMHSTVYGYTRLGVIHQLQIVSFPLFYPHMVQIYGYHPATLHCLVPSLLPHTWYNTMCRVIYQLHIVWFPLFYSIHGIIYDCHLLTPYCLVPSPLPQTWYIPIHGGNNNNDTILPYVVNVVHKY